MPRISSDKLMNGMVLVKPLTGKNGMVILGEGAELTEKWIERIRNMDVEMIFVDGPSEQPIPLDEAIARLEVRFEPVQGKPYMVLLKKTVRNHIEKLYESQ